MALNLHLINKTPQGCQRGGEEGEQGAVTLARGMHAGIDWKGAVQARETCDRTNTGAKVKTLLGQHLLLCREEDSEGLSPHPASMWRQELAGVQMSGRTQGKGVVDIYCSRIWGAAYSPGPLMPTEPGVSNDTQCTLPVLPSAASPSSPVLHILCAPAYEGFSWVQSSPGTGTYYRMTSHLTGNSAPHQAQNRLKKTRNKFPGFDTEVIQILEVLRAVWIHWTVSVISPASCYCHFTEKHGR